MSEVSNEKIFEALEGVRTQCTTLGADVHEKLAEQREQIRTVGAASDANAKAFREINERYESTTKEALDINRELLTRVVGLLEEDKKISGNAARLMLMSAESGMRSGGMQLYDVLTQSEEFKAYVERGMSGVSPPIKFHGRHRPFEHSHRSRRGGYAKRDEFYHGVSDLQGGDLGFNFPEIVDIALRMMRVADMIPWTPVNAGQVRYVEETVQDVLLGLLETTTGPGDTTITLKESAEGFFPGQEITFSDGTTKRTIDSIDFDTRVVTLTAAVGAVFPADSKVTSDTFSPTEKTKLNPFAKIALETKTSDIKDFRLMLAVPDSYLQDIPLLSGFLTNRMPLFMGMSKDQQILHGNPTVNSREIQGIGTAAGIQTYTQGTIDPDETEIDALRRAATLVALQFYLAEAFPIHPIDLANIEMQKADDGKYIYMDAPYRQDGIQRIWRMTPVETSAAKQGESLVGAYSVAVMGWDRMMSELRFLDQHEDYAARGLIAVRMIERLGLSVLRPQGICKTFFT